MTLETLNKQITKKRLNKVTRNFEYLIADKMWVTGDNLSKLVK